MDFTYKEYIKLIKLLKKEYQFTNYTQYEDVSNPVIFRHDVDNSLEKALAIAKIDNENGVKSTFFVLLATDFYNLFSKRSGQILNQIMSLGHEVGLHFDEKRYEITDSVTLEYYIEYERNVLENILQKTVNTVSMHRPSKWVLENDLQFSSIINVYSQEFLHEFKYLSDSKMYWREDVLGIVNAKKYSKIHILTHPFWYSEDNNSDIKEKVSGFIKSASKERYDQMKDNITNFEEIFVEDELYENRVK